MAIFASDIQRTILEYYGSDSTIWQRIQTGAATEQEIIQALGSAPQVQPVYSQSGYVLGYDWAEPLANDLDVIMGSADSNSIPGMYSSGNSFNALIPADFTESSGGGATISSGLKDNLGNTVAAITDKINLAVTGANIGAKLGKSLGTDLYESNPNWWADNLPDVGPWFNDIFGQDDVLGNFVRTYLTVGSDGTTAYIDEKVLAYYYQLLRDKGVYNVTPTVDPSQVPGLAETWSGDTTLSTPPYGGYWRRGVASACYMDEYIGYDKFICGACPTGATPETTQILFVFYSTNPNLIFSRKRTNLISGEATTTTLSLGNSIVIDDVTYYWTTTQGSNTSYSSLAEVQEQSRTSFILGIPSNIINCTSSNPSQQMAKDMIKIAQTEVPAGGVDGINDIDGATQYPPRNITGTTTQDVLDQLKQQYPDLFTGALKSNVLQPDGTYEEKTYVPIPWCDDLTTDQTQPTTDTLTKAQTQDRTQIEDKTLEDIVIKTDTDNPPTQDTPDTGNGQATPPVIPTGSASSLWAIYNPTQTELNSFGAWLWSSNFVDQLKKLFNDPMQAIIGIHKVFATPATGSSSTIKCGYIDSGVSAKKVTDQYTSIDCGSVNMYEYFGNVFDYDPFTSVKIYLPFIGIVPLDVSYIMRSKINVVYKVDVLSGACIANVKITRDGFGSVLFTYGGSAIVTYPISSGSYMGMISGALSIIAGVAGTVASGGTLAPAMVGAASGIGRMKTDIQHSGQFSGACGAMGAKKPYLIISRPQTKVAGNIEQYEGIPSNSYLQLSECVGYTKVKSVHLSIPGAYDSELQEIEQLLKEGIII